MIALVLLFTAILVVRSVTHVVPDYQRVAVFSFGRFEKMAGPGIVLALPPPLQSLVPVDLREMTLSVPVRVSDRDGAPVEMRLEISHQIVDPRAAVVKVLDPLAALRLAAEKAATQLRWDDITFYPNDVAKDLRADLDGLARDWGARVTNVEIKKIEPRGSEAARA